MDRKSIAESWLRSLAWIAKNSATTGEESVDQNEHGDQPLLHTVDGQTGGGEEDGSSLAI